MLEFATQTLSNMNYFSMIQAYFHSRSPLRQNFCSQPSSAGFSLVELLVVLVASGTLLAAAGSTIISQIQITTSAARLEKLRGSWASVINLMETEVALSETIYTDSNAINIPSQCNVGFEFRAALDVGKNLPLAIYGIKTSPSTLAGDSSIWRCGPRINQDGSYSSQYNISILTDGLDNSALGNGFQVTQTNTKIANIVFAFKNDKGSSFKLDSNSTSRISPLFIFPNNSTSCQLANNFAQIGSTISLSTSGLACGTGISSNTINGSLSDDILEAGPDATSSRITGNGGNDFLRGSKGNDVLIGGIGDDILIGLDGNDSLTGGGGQNQYLPGKGTNSINGSSSGVDIIFLDGNKSSYSISSPCSKTSCTITAPGESHAISEGDTIIFKDGRIDID